MPSRPEWEEAPPFPGQAVFNFYTDVMTDAEKAALGLLLIQMKLRKDLVVSEYNRYGAMPLRNRPAWAQDAEAYTKYVFAYQPWKTEIKSWIKEHHPVMEKYRMWQGANDWLAWDWEAVEYNSSRFAREGSLFARNRGKKRGRRG